MRLRRILLVVAALASSFAFAAEPSAADLLRLLNSRSSGSPRLFASAAREVSGKAREGHLLHQFVMALLSEEKGLPDDIRPTPAEREAYLEKARSRIRALAEERNNPLAWYLLYLDSRDTALLDKAVAAGNIQALNAAGTARMMRALDDPDRESREEMMRTCFGYFKQAADQDDANGLNNLGICHQNGYGCPKDEAAAFACFTRAAKQGHAEAINNLGRFHREGIVVEKDLAAALRCFRLSAGQGNYWGQVNYALALIRGEGAPADVARGIDLLESIAAGGNADAMDCLANCYAKGLGELQPDSWKAAVWTVRARAARGDKNAAEWLKENHEDTHDR